MNRFYTLKPIAENIWIVDGDLIEMDAVLTKLLFFYPHDGHQVSKWPALVPFTNPTKSSLVWTSWTLWGPVAHLVSPNKIHYAYIADWKKRYP